MDGFQPDHVVIISLQLGKSSTDLHKLQEQDATIRPVLLALDTGHKPDQLKQ